jgi:hypothetical protein
METSMRSDINVMGIFFVSLFIYMMIAIPIFMIIRRALFVSGFYRLVWHPNLFELALYTVIVSLLVLMVPL